MMRPEEVLVCRIFEQAIEDYNYLRINKIEKKSDDSGRYSIKDVENFFNSHWCAYLLDTVGCKLTGKDILGKIKAQCA